MVFDPAKAKEQRQECGVLLLVCLVLLYLFAGVLSLVFGIKQVDSQCGAGGHPPLPRWLLGTGISFTLIGLTMAVVGTVMLFRRRVDGLGALMLISNVFSFAWMLVGSVSLWKDGLSCQQEPEVFIVGALAWICALTICLLNCASTSLTAKSQKELEYEEAVQTHDPHSAWSGY